MTQKYCEFFTENAEGSICEEQPQCESNRKLKVRLDKWLWAARFFKTRTLARAAIEHGKVLYNGELVSPNIEIQLHSKVNIRAGKFNKYVIITGLSTRRKNSTDALELFEELPIQDNINEFPTYDYNNVDTYVSQKPKKSIRYLRRYLTKA